MYRSLILSLLLLLPAAALAEDRYVGLFVGSQHIGSDEFNDFNPGLTIGRRRPLGSGPWERFIEAGVFYNSYEEVSPIVATGLSRPVARIGPGEVHVGAALALAYYRELSEDLRDDDIPTLGPFVTIPSLNASYRTERVDYRLTFLPPGGDVDGVVTLSLGFPF